MAVNLTAGAVSMLSGKEWQTTDLKPVLQVMDIRIVQTQTSAGGAGGENKERYRVLLSDGSFHQQGMLASQLNELVRSQQLQKGSIVHLTEFVCNAIRDRTIIIIINLNVIIGACDIIGDPKPFPLKPPGNETPSVERSVAPMQSSLNQPSITTVSDAQCTTKGTPVVPIRGPISNAVPTTHTPELQHNAGLRSYSNSFNNNSANNHMRPIQPAFNQIPPMYGNRGPIAKNEAPARIIPIAALNPYQGKWTIKARVTAKSELRRYNNAKGDGKVFSFDLLDSDGEIRATCFNAVADQFYNQIEVGKVYYLSKGSVKPAQKAFNHLKNDHEITLDHTSTIQPCFDDDNSIPRQQFHFRSIAEIESMDINSVLDVIGIVSGIYPSSVIRRKNGDETLKQTLSLKDMSGKSVSLTLWGNFCNSEGQKIQSMCDSGQFPVLAVKSARVYDFNGKTIGTISSSQLSIEPDFLEARKLKEWFNSVGRNAPSVSLSRDAISRTDAYKTISQIKDEKLGISEKADWITVNATIAQMRFETFCYPACPNMTSERSKCSKKVLDNGDGTWRCDKCDKTVEECEYRYILQLVLQDHTGLTWATAFQEAGEEIMGVSAKDLHFMKYEEQDDDRFSEIVRNVILSQFTFKLKVKEEVYGEDQRVKVTVVKAERIKFSSNTKILLLELEKMCKREDPSSVAVNHGLNSQLGAVGQQAALPASHVVQQAAVPASHVGHYESQYGGSGGRINSGECFKCHQSGHWARDCPGVSKVPSYGGY